LGRADTVTETGDAYKSILPKLAEKHRKAVANSEPRTKVFKAPVHPGGATKKLDGNGSPDHACDRSYQQQKNWLYGLGMIQTVYKPSTEALTETSTS